MKFKVVVATMLTLLAISLLVLTFNFQSVKATDTVISLNPIEYTAQLGDSFTIDVTVTNVTDFGAWEFKLNYNTTILDAIYVSPTPYTENNTDWLPVDALGNWHPDGPPTINDPIGRVWVGALIPVALGQGLHGSFPLVTINFTATGVGNSALDLYDTVLGDSYGSSIYHVVINGSVTVLSEATPPTWSNAGTNNTKAGKPILFHVKWTDNFELSGFIFGTNNTGTWANDTWKTMSGATDWSNVTRTLNPTPGILIQWRVWANDTSNNWNDTGVLSLTTSQPPHAQFTYSPSTPYTSENVNFNATSSYDSDGYIVNYFWDFGDNTTGTGNITTHSYADNGVYTVTLNVTDNDGLSDTFSADVIVLNRPPVADADGPYSGYEESPITFDASGSTDMDGIIVLYEWDWDNDGGYDEGTTSPFINHTWTDDYSGTVGLRVTDDDGLTDTATAPVTVALLADTTKPSIGTPSQDPPESHIEPHQKVTVSVNVTDDQSGVREVILQFRYSADGGQTWTEWTNVTMSNPMGDTYTGEIPGFIAGIKVQYSIVAYDNANNNATNNKAGLYYVYTIVPEFPSGIAWIAVIAITSLAVFLGSRKVQGRKHARAASRVNSLRPRDFNILRIWSNCFSTVISNNELYCLLENNLLL